MNNITSEYSNLMGYSSPSFADWPEVFQTPSLVETLSPQHLCADGLCAWANCMMGHSPPSNFGEVLVAIGKKLNMSNAATEDNLIAYARRMGWSSSK